MVKWSSGSTTVHKENVKFNFSPGPGPESHGGEIAQTLQGSPNSPRTHKGEVAGWSQAVCPLCRRITVLVKRLVDQIQHLIARESLVFQYLKQKFRLEKSAFVLRKTWNTIRILIPMPAQRKR